MEIISPEFAAFVLVTLILYYMLRGKWQNRLLLLASYSFYITWSWKYALVLLAVTLFNYAYAFLVARKIKGSSLWLWLGVALNSGTFFILLFADFINRSMNTWLTQLFHGAIEINLLLPLGFAYYIMQCISYLLDIQMKIAQPCRSLEDFALYLAYFPKLVSGPIERARKFLPILQSNRTLDNVGFSRSLMLILAGLFQNTVLAGLLSVFVPGIILTRPQDFSRWDQIVGLLTFAFFLYNQFSGYTKLVRGISGLFGIPLSQNFAYPFFSKDFSDFWKRWHISLSEWFRDYIYLRLSRAFLRRNPKRTNLPNLILPPLATMFVSGLWHGARLHLLVWGLLNGIFIIAENTLNLFRKAVPSAKPPLWRALLSHGLVIGLALSAALPFKLTLTQTKAFMVHFFLNPWGTIALPPLILMCVSLLWDYLHYLHNDEFILLRLPRGAQAILAALCTLSVIIVYHLQNAPTTFIYP